MIAADRDADGVIDGQDQMLVTLAPWKIKKTRKGES